MLTIFAVHNNQHIVKEWMIADSSPLNLHQFDSVKNIQVDGDELDYVYSRFPSLCMVRNAKSVKWFGDDAKFIVGNLV